MSAIVTMDLQQVIPGFREPVFGSQACFRAVLDALSRPGERRWVKSALPGPEPLAPATAALALTLLDHETSVWLSPATVTPRTTAFIRFHTGARLVDDPRDADFAIVTRASELPPLSAFRAGTDEIPESSTTVVVQVEAFDDGPGWRLTGPGVRDVASLRAFGLPAAFVGEWASNHALFPRGIDVILVDGDVVCGLPRTTRIEA